MYKVYDVIFSDWILELFVCLLKYVEMSKLF